MQRLVQLGDQKGQAAVEFLTVLPLLIVALLVAWQFVVTGHCWWLTTEAARQAAREASVAQASQSVTPLVRARRTVASVLPATWDAARVVSLPAPGLVKVSLRVPLVAPLAAVVQRRYGPRITVHVGFEPAGRAAL